MDTMYGASACGYYQYGGSRAWHLVLVNDGLFARLCYSILRYGILLGASSLAVKVFGTCNENRRGSYDSNGDFTVYGSDDENYGLAKYDYTGMAEVLGCGALLERSNKQRSLHM